MDPHHGDFQSLVGALKGALAYALFGVLWIYSSDAVLAALVTDPGRLTTLQTYKGWFFILVTAVLVHYLLHRHGLAMRRSRAELQQSETSLDLLFRALPVGAGTAKGRVLATVNERLCEISGYSREEMVGQETAKFYVDEDEAERVGRILYREIAERGSGFLEARWRRKDGQVRRVLVGLAVAHKGADPTDVVFSVTDITEQREQEALYRLLFEGANDALFLMDDRTFLDCNSRALEMYGARREQLVGTSPLDFSPAAQPDGRASAQAAREHIIAAMRGEPQVFEWLHHRQDKTPFHAEISLNRIDRGDGVCLLAIARDITRRKQDEAARRKSEESLSSIFRTVPTGIGVIRNRVLETVNDRFCEIFGYDREELLGQGTRRLYASEEEYRRCGQGIYQGLDSGGVSAVECRMVRNNGQGIHVLITSTLLESGDGGPAVTSSVLDITERKQVLDALKSSEDYLASIFRVVPTGVAVVEDRVMVEVNDRFCEIFGYEREELVGRTAQKLYASEEEYQRCGREYYSCLEKQGVCSVEAHGVRKDGREIYLLVNASMFSRAGGGKTYTFSVLDITDRKRAEEELRRSRDTLEDMVRERTHELVESNAELQRLIAESDGRSAQAAVLNDMGELLQACETEEETHQVVGGVCAKLFPEDAGCVGILDEADWSIKVVAMWGNVEDCSMEFAHNDCWAIRRGKAHVVLEPDTDPLCNHVGRAPECGTLCVPMGAQGRVLGMAHLLLACGLKDLGAQELRRVVNNRRILLSGVVERYAPSLVNLRLRETLREQSIRDRLTGLFNRRHMEEALRRELARARRRNLALSVIMIDVDHFKRFNDTYGHETGDTVLRELGRFLLDHVRAEDIPCRYGGEELLLILPESCLEASMSRAEDIRRGIEQEVAASHAGERLQVTASLGVAAYPAHGQDMDTLLSATDSALYRAKENGRNQVVAYAG